MAGGQKRGLGKGLEALFGDVEIDTKEVEKKQLSKKADVAAGNGASEANGIALISINDIKPNSEQPRKNFDEDKLNELAASIKEHGVIQPIVLRETKGGYEIVAGERRWRAARIAELKKVPCIVKELTDEQNMLLAIIENMQREDLNPIEEAEGIDRMIGSFGLTQEQVAKSVGKSRPYITNALRLLKLPESIRDMVSKGELSMGHARALLGLENVSGQEELAAKIVKEDLSVRAVEKIIKDKQVRRKPRVKVHKKDTDVIQVEGELKDALGTKVTLNQKGKKGKIEIEYYSRDDLERLIELLRSLK